MGAMDEEVRLIRSDLVGARVVPGPCEMIAGRLEGRPVILARSGIGKVNAALAAAAMVSAGASSIVFTGVAGAVAEGLGVGDVVIGDRFV
ncbi:MAG: 5'-methylthioadenosine/adenosylhomocysteine nucleosidase, partial [Acidipropionibacterium jensenii]|nr:5'-methylthioadenosine/adenosylhomocysteine nucleosidase [Acidipropionibacterium jensenii]